MKNIISDETNDSEKYKYDETRDDVYAILCLLAIGMLLGALIVFTLYR